VQYEGSNERFLGDDIFMHEKRQWQKQQPAGKSFLVRDEQQMGSMGNMQRGWLCVEVCERRCQQTYEEQDQLELGVVGVVMLSDWFCCLCGVGRV